MKNWSLLFISFLFSNILFAQLEKPERQIGFDATAFITRFLTFNDQLSGTSNPEILFLYRKEKNGKYLRYGIGGRFSYENSDIGNPIREKILFVRLDFKFGREYRKDFSKRWRAYYGWDVLIGASESSTESIGNALSGKFVIRGANLRVNPLVGIQFSLNERLSLSTEIAYGLEATFDSNSFNSDSIKTYRIQTFYAPPISLFLNYKI